MSLPLSTTIRDTSYIKWETDKNVGPGTYDLNNNNSQYYQSQGEAVAPFATNEK